jgi:hypothetical protein
MEIRQTEKLNRIDYVRKSKRNKSEPNYENLTLVDKQRLGFAEMLDQIESNGRVLYHLTLTYIPTKYKSKDWTVDQINGFFREFYVKYFLRKVLNTSHISNKRQKERQPIVFCFVDESAFNKSSVTQTNIANRSLSSLSGDRLHHHAIICAHPDTVNRLDDLLGENTFKDSEFGKRIQSSSLRRCESDCILYANKNLSRIQDYQIYPQIPLDALFTNTLPVKKSVNINQMKSASDDLDAELHIRVSKLFDKKLRYLARQNNVTKSTFARQVLINHISSLET